MTRTCVLATSQLNQWSLDWDGNRDRILTAVLSAREAHATLLLTPELSIPGYGLLDHWLENDVYSHSWDVVADILARPETRSIILDLGLPLRHRGCSYNARLLACNGRILALRPKLDLCNDGNFREMRYFSPWPRGRVDDFPLPDCIRRLPAGQQSCRVGEVIFDTLDASFASETCEELWTPRSPHARYTLAGVEIVCNSSGSHHELRKLHTRIALMLEATATTGGVYLYANQRGCDGDRLYYDGSAMIMDSGRVLAQGSQFSLRDVEVQTAVVDLDEIWASRKSRSRGLQANEPDVHTLERIPVDFRLCRASDIPDPTLPWSLPIETRYHDPEEEIALGPACWLWDYLRRSRAAGFIVPLSGGIDSCATATIVYSMCRMVAAEVAQGNEVVIADAQRLCGRDPVGLSPAQLCHHIFTTVFMGMRQQSSTDTRRRARDLAAAIGARHIDTDIDDMVAALHGVVARVCDFEPRFAVHGGSPAENLALQNFQSRSRMVLTYALGQLLPTARADAHNRSGGLLVLGSANVDECLRGYLTKYDCSSADINPIGGISKTDLRRFIKWAAEHFALAAVLDPFLHAVPTAELEPLTDSHVQSDEADMGFTYDELSTLGRLRKIALLGPVGMFRRLAVDWRNRMPPRAIADKVMDFIRFYARNRHKMTVMTPALYLEAYTPDDNRYDLRCACPVPRPVKPADLPPSPFLYPSFVFERRKIDNILRQVRGRGVPAALMCR